MSTQRLTLVRSGNSSWEELRREEQRLCSIIDSGDTTDDERYEALLALAELTGIPVRRIAEVA